VRGGHSEARGEEFWREWRVCLRLLEGRGWSDM